MSLRCRRIRQMMMVLFCALFVVLPMSLMGPAQAADPAFPGTIGLVPTTVRISPASGPPDTRITVQGTGFDPLICRGVAGLRWRGSLTTLVSVPLNADGTFTAVVRAPARGLFGTQARLAATCGPGLIALPAPGSTFTITASQPSQPSQPSPPSQPPPPVATPAPSPPPAAQPAPSPQPTHPGTTPPGSRPTSPSGDDGSNPSDGSNGSDGTDGSNGSGGSNGPNGADGGTSPGAGDGSSPGGSSGGEPLATASPGTTSGPGSTGATPAPGSSVVAGAAPAAGTGSSDQAGSGVLRPARVTSFVPTLAEIPFSPEIVLLSLALAGLFIVLIAFPAELFNSTLEENEEEITGLLAGPRAAITGRAGPVLTRMKGALGVSAASRAGSHRRPMQSGAAFAAFVIVGTALTLVLAGDEAAGGNWPAQIAGLMIAIALVTVIAEVPEEFTARFYSGVGGRFQILSAAVAIAVVCTLVSRVLHLQPAYLYGLFAGFAAAGTRRLSKRQQGLAVLASIIAISVAGLVAWIVWTPVHAAAYAGTPSWPAVLGDSILFWVFALSAEGLVFALIPLRFLDGAVLRSWRLTAWLLPQVASAAFFFYVFVLHGENPNPNGMSLMIRASVFFLIFAVISVGFWAYFRWDGRPSRPPAEQESDSIPAS